MFNFNRKGPKGSFGQIWFSDENPHLVQKRTISKKKNKLREEAKKYRQVADAIKCLGLQHIRTIRTTPEHYDETSGFFTMQRLYPLPGSSHKDIQLDYSIINEDDKEWLYSPDKLSSYINYNPKELAYELGKLWMEVLVSYNLILWEPELMVAKLKNEDKYSIFIMDFDKSEYITKGSYTSKNEVELHNFLTNIFPTPDSRFFEDFSSGLVSQSEYHGQAELGKKIIENFINIFNKQ